MVKALILLAAVIGMGGCQTKVVELETTSGETIILNCVVDSVFTQPCYIKGVK